MYAHKMRVQIHDATKIANKITNVCVRASFQFTSWHWISSSSSSSSSLNGIALFCLILFINILRVRVVNRWLCTIFYQTTSDSHWQIHNRMLVVREHECNNNRFHIEFRLQLCSRLCFYFCFDLPYSPIPSRFILSIIRPSYLKMKSSIEKKCAQIAKWITLKIIAKLKSFIETRTHTNTQTERKRSSERERARGKRDGIKM